MRLIFARHGQSEANVLRLMSNRDLPHGLTALGREQATRLAVSVAAEKPVALYCSPILRAVQTAEIVGAACKLRPIRADGLREPDCGVLEGLGDPASWKVHDSVVATWVAGDESARPPGGESLLEVRARFEGFMRLLLATREVRQGPVAIVAHGSLLGNLLPRICNNLPLDAAARYGLPNAESIVITGSGVPFTCESWAGTRPHNV